MTNTDEQVHEIEMDISIAKQRINNMQSLMNLSKNQDFRQLIDINYLQNEAIRLVHFKSDPTQQDPQDQKMLDNQIIAIGEFKKYLMTIMQLGQMAQNGMRDMEDTQEELLNESL